MRELEQAFSFLACRHPRFWRWFYLAANVCQFLDGRGWTRCVRNDTRFNGWI